MLEADKVMFEIYRETQYTGKYRVVYFTELTEHNKEWEINRALAGEHFYDGFIKNWRKEKAKAIIEDFIRRLNEGESLTPEQLEEALREYIPVSR
ncbi:MAG: hypothetical protein HY653_08785 [Acidobacteria bacterium]|nr:hypothetical protein [Acidobacteriota bacterium]